MAFFKFLFIAFLFGLGSSCFGKTDESYGHKFKSEEIFKTSGVIWGFDFLNEDEVILSTRSGEMHHLNLKTKESKQLTGIPEVHSKGQGGLLDVAIKQLGEDSWVYFTYSKPVEGGSTVALARAKWSNDNLKDIETIFEAKASGSKNKHYGSRIAFQGDDYVFISIGDRGERDRSQELSSHVGAIVRLSLEGETAKSNPFAEQEGALPEIWSYGHRNPQGLSFRPGTDELWSVEFGPRGGDELNFIKPGANYGWPVITYGKEYWGPSIGEGTKKEGMEQPVVHYTPSISPSGMTFYEGDKFPKWKGHLFLAALGNEYIQHIVLDGQKVSKQKKILENLGERVRQVNVSPAGQFFFSTDSGKLFTLRAL